jgi:hypothetical protein
MVHVRWGPCPRSMARPRVADGGTGYMITVIPDASLLQAHVHSALATQSFILRNVSNTSTMKRIPNAVILPYAVVCISNTILLLSTGTWLFVLIPLSNKSLDRLPTGYGLEEVGAGVWILRPAQGTDTYRELLHRDKAAGTWSWPLTSR